jgi:uncharacterized membrane protein YkvA (DUF1232 family)
MKKIVIIITGILSALYLLNPTAGVFEFIPDLIPGIGNLDEATATTLLLASLSYFGIDLTRFFKNEDKKGNKKK